MLRLSHPLGHHHPFVPFTFSSTSSFQQRFEPALSLNTSLASSFFFSPAFPPVSSRLRLRYSGQGGDAAGSADKFKGFVGEQVEALLRREENRALMDGLEDATRRVEVARRALADIERQEAEAVRTKEYVLQLESRRTEIEESQKELERARTMVEEAERSLSLNIGGMASQDVSKTSEVDEVNKGMERIESIKAAGISSVVGVLAGLPISLSQASSNLELLAHLAVISISCALFGVTFRYTIRRDLDNIQLKTGTCAAFGFVRGLSAAETSKPWEFDNILPLAVNGVTHVSEGIFIFIFSAVALDYSIKMGLLKPFPIKN